MYVNNTYRRNYFLKANILFSLKMIYARFGEQTFKEHDIRYKMYKIGEDKEVMNIDDRY